MDKPKVNVALIGSGFMGRAHSNGLRQAKTFFDLPVEPVLKVLGARNPETGEKIANSFGWEEIVPNWRDVINRPDIQIVDIDTPVHTHYEIAIAAIKAGKAVICEKPLSATLEEALEMAQAAEQAGVPNMCNYNLRTTPAITFAHQLIHQGAIGKINQWRAAFMQSWLVNPNFPLTWRLRKEFAGSGALGDLGSHSIDLARYLVGDIKKINAMMHTFTKERSVPVKDIGRNSIPSGEMGKVSVDDAVWALLHFTEDAFGTMEATRMATGQLCSNRFQVYGTEGGISFDFMRLNELEYYSLKDAPTEQGWRTIHVTAPMHPYLGAWWPKGHSLGYEHTFAHLLSDFFIAYAKDESPSPDFRDAAKTQAVLAAIEQSAQRMTWVDVEQA